MAGRDLSPGENPYGNILDPKGVHDRTIRCLVHGVDNKNGFVTLEMDAFPSVGRYATVPLLWASFPDPAHGLGAWGRYMPFQQDCLKVSFDYDDRPHIVGYDVVGNSNKENVADGRAGWPQARRAQEAGKLPFFKPLESGEYDFMSIGGAYIKGSSLGQLLLAVDDTNITVDGSTTSINGEAIEYKFTSTGCVIRYGQVRRALPPPFVGEVAGTVTQPNPLALWNTDGTKNEFQVEINNLLPIIGPSPAIPVARFAIGNVSTSIGPDLSSSVVPSPRLFALETFDPTGLIKTFMFESDLAGNSNMLITLNQQTTVLLSSKLTVGTKYDVSVGANSTLTVGGSHDVSVGLSHDVFVGGSYTLGATTIDQESKSTAIYQSTGSASIISKASVLVQAPAITLAAGTGCVIQSPVVAIGSAPAGGIMNGTLYAAATAPVATAAAAIAAAGAAMSAIPGPALNGAVGPQLAALAAAIQAMLAAITPSTSVTVTVSL